MVKKNELNEKLDLILRNQKKILKNEEKILSEEKKLEAMEAEELEKEDLSQKTEEETLQELMKLEKQLKKSNYDPIRKIGKRDLFKGFVGAFAGLMSHFAFSKGYDLGASLSIYQASVLYVVAFVVINIMLYYTGFRKVQKHLVMRFMPLRALILYSVSVLTILLIYTLFGKIYFPFDLTQIYTVVGSSITLAVMGAGTADLIGGNSH